MAAPAAAFAGFVLAGGRSRRMGRDKALLEIDGVPLVARATAALGDAGACDVTVIGGDLASFVALGLAAVPDRHPGEGPLDGLVRALELAGERRAVVLSCDLANPSATNIAAVAAALGADHDATVPTWQGRPQWLHAGWAPRCRDVLTRRFAAGERRIGVAVSPLTVTMSEVPEPARLRDIDTPEDLAEVLREERRGR